MALQTVRGSEVQSGGRGEPGDEALRPVPFQRRPATSAAARAHPTVRCECPFRFSYFFLFFNFQRTWSYCFLFIYYLSEVKTSRCPQQHSCRVLRDGRVKNLWEIECLDRCLPFYRGCMCSNNFAFSFVNFLLLLLYCHSYFLWYITLRKNLELL